MSGGVQPSMFFLRLPDLKKLCCITLTLQEDEELRSKQIKTCRELVLLFSDVLASPALDSFTEITVVMAISFFQSGILQVFGQRHSLQLGSPQCVFPGVIQCCLSYSLITRLAPSWNKAGLYLITGKDFLTETGRLNAVSMEMSTSEGQLCISVEASTVRLPPITLEDFDLPPLVLRRFCSDPDCVLDPASTGGAIWCHVLPSMKKGQIITISRRLPRDGPFRTDRDLQNHWNHLYGYRLPELAEEEVVYCSVYFRLVGERLFTYPLSCVRLQPVQRCPRVDLQGALGRFLSDVRDRLQSVCGFPARLTSKPCYHTVSLSTAATLQVLSGEQVNLTFSSSIRPVLTQLPPPRPPRPMKPLLGSQPPAWAPLSQQDGAQGPLGNGSGFRSRLTQSQGCGGDEDWPPSSSSSSFSSSSSRVSFLFSDSSGYQSASSLTISSSSSSSSLPLFQPASSLTSSSSSSSSLPLFQPASSLTSSSSTSSSLPLFQPASSLTSSSSSSLPLFQPASSLTSSSSSSLLPIFQPASSLTSSSSSSLPLFQPASSLTSSSSSSLPLFQPASSLTSSSSSSLLPLFQPASSLTSSSSSSLPLFQPASSLTSSSSSSLLPLFQPASSLTSSSSSSLLPIFQPASSLTSSSISSSSVFSRLPPPSQTPVILPPKLVPIFRNKCPSRHVNVALLRVQKQKEQLIGGGEERGRVTLPTFRNKTPTSASSSSVSSSSSASFPLPPPPTVPRFNRHPKPHSGSAAPQPTAHPKVKHLSSLSPVSRSRPGIIRAPKLEIKFKSKSRPKTSVKTSSENKTAANSSSEVQEKATRQASADVSNKDTSSSRKGVVFESKPKKSRPAVRDVDVEKMARSNQLSKLNSATLLAWLKGRGALASAKQRKEELMLKVMGCLAEA